MLNHKHQPFTICILPYNPPKVKSFLLYRPALNLPRSKQRNSSNINFAKIVKKE